MRNPQRARSIAARAALAALAVVWLTTTPATAEDTTADSWNDAAVAAARDQLVDLLASESIERIDFRAPTYDEALGLIETVAGDVLQRTRGTFPTPAQAVECIRTVAVTFDDHTPRGLSTTFFDQLSFPVSDQASAQELAEVLGDATVIVAQYAGPDAAADRVATAADNLFQTPILDPTEGQYLRQYREELGRILALPRADRLRFLDR